MRKNILLLFFALFSFSSIHAKVKYTFNNGTLTISGTDMPDYSMNGAPWCKYLAQINTVVIEDGVTSIGTFAFFSCFNFNSLSIPNSVKKIGDQAFYGCEALTSVTIPNSVTTIGNSAFFYCLGLTSITISNSVKSIGEQAFGLCKDLTSITFEGITPPEFGKDAFRGVNKSIPVYVPANSIEAYKKALGDYFEETSIQALQD